MTKKVFIIAGIVFAVVIAALVIQRVFLSQDKKADNIGEQTSAEEIPVQQEQAAESGKIHKAIDASTMGATLAKSTSQIIYFQDSRFQVASFEGQVRSTLGQYPFSNIEELKWNNNRDKVIISDDGGLQIFDMNKTEPMATKSGVDYAVWDDKEDKIVYKFYDFSSKKRSINISDPDGSNWTTLLEELPHVRVELLPVSKNNEVCYYPAPNGGAKGALECVKKDSKEHRIAHQGEYGAEYLFSPNGDKILMSYSQERNQNKLILAVMNKDGGELKGLSFPTSVQKCVWAKDNVNIFCGNINDMPDHAILPNDWIDGKFNSSDTFWKINTQDGKKTRLLELSETPGQLDGFGYFLDRIESNLLFTDKKTGNIYRIEL